MNAIPKIETAEEGARRLFVHLLATGFALTDIHWYRDAKGEPLFCRVRFTDAEGNKEIRPLRFDGHRFEAREPPFPPKGKPLYRLPELVLANNEAPVWIVEGEKCADVLANLGILATTSGGSGSAGSADWAPLAGRKCILWPDNDKSGSAYMTHVTNNLFAQDCDIEIVDISTMQLPAKGDCVDWLAAHPNADIASIMALQKRPAPPQLATARNAPEPLRRPLPPPEPYPVAELGPILGPACKSLGRVIQAPDAVCGASLLAAASLSVQGLANVENDGRIHPLSLWCFTIAESGERKSAVDAEAMQPVRDYERALSYEYDELAKDFEVQLEEWNARREKAKRDAKKSGGAGLTDALRKIGPQPNQPLRPTLIIADFTAEGLAKLLVVGRPSVGAFTDEAALVFGGHGMTKETVTRTAGTLSKLWDSGTLDRVRASEGPIKLYGRRFATHLMAQPVVAEQALSNDILSGQGFLARCLIAWPESTAGQRPYRAESLADDAALIIYRSRIADLLRRPMTMAEGQRNVLEPRALRLSPDAKSAWRTVHDTIEAAMAPGARYAGVKPFASKAPEQCLRIAGVLTLLESPDAEFIDAATIDRAAELTLWHLNEAVRLQGTAEIPPVVRDAEALLKWCHETGRTKLHSRDALRLGPARIRHREAFEQAMSELVNAGWATPVEGGEHLDGSHRRRVWRITDASEGR